MGARAGEPDRAPRGRRVGGGQSTFADVEEAMPGGAPSGSWRWGFRMNREVLRSLQNMLVCSPVVGLSNEMRSLPFPKPLITACAALAELTSVGTPESVILATGESPASSGCRHASQSPSRISQRDHGRGAGPVQFFRKWASVVGSEISKTSTPRSPGADGKEWKRRERSARGK